MLDDKINKNLSAIVYRYIYRFKINEVNDEYKRIFRLDTNDNRLSFIVRHPINGRSRKDMNYRNLEQSIDGWRCIRNINLNNLQKCGQFVYKEGVVVQLPKNYKYTSTKYLREIKERGIKCLIDNR